MGTSIERTTKPVYVFHASPDAQHVTQYLRWTQSESSKMLVLATESPIPKLTAGLFFDTLSRTGLQASELSVGRHSPAWIAVRAQWDVVVIFVDQKEALPLADEIAQLITGSGIPALSFPPDKPVNDNLVSPGEGLAIRPKYVATCWHRPVAGKLNSSLPVQ